MRDAPALVRFWVAMLALVLAQFALRPRLGDPRFTPDFVLIALLFFAIRTRPSLGAAAGFSVGMLADAVAPTAFGAAAFASTSVGYAAAWLKTVFFADNLLVNALFVFVAAWLRDVIQVLAANQLGGATLAWQLLAYSPAAALATAAAALLALVVLRGWLRAGQAR